MQRVPKIQDFRAFRGYDRKCSRLGNKSGTCLLMEATDSLTAPHLQQAGPQQALLRHKKSHQVIFAD
jgi:hypothetical protein